MDAQEINKLKQSLQEQGIPLSRQVFSDVMFEAWVEFKRAEWLSYLNRVSDWERDRYLKFF